LTPTCPAFRPDVASAKASGQLDLSSDALNTLMSTVEACFGPPSEVYPFFKAPEADVAQEAALSIGVYTMPGPIYRIANACAQLKDRTPMQMAKIQPFYRCVLVWRWWSLITIVRLDDGTVVRHIGGKDGNDNNEFKNPQGIAALPDGCLAAADCCNHRIKIVRSDSTFVCHIGTGNQANGTNEFDFPTAVAVWVFGCKRLPTPKKLVEGTESSWNENSWRKNS
jgi:hypothetical protein